MVLLFTKSAGKRHDGRNAVKRYILLISFLTCGNVSCKKDNGGVQPWRNTQKADAPEEIGPGVYRHITPALMRRGELDEGPSSSDIRLGQVDIDKKREE